MTNPQPGETRRFWRINRSEPDEQPTTIDLTFGRAAFEACVWFSCDPLSDIDEVDANPDGSIFDESGEQEVFLTKAEALQGCIELMQERVQAYMTTMGSMDREIRQLLAPLGQSYDI